MIVKFGYSGAKIVDFGIKQLSVKKLWNKPCETSSGKFRATKK